MPTTQGTASRGAGSTLTHPAPQSNSPTHNGGIHRADDAEDDDVAVDGERGDGGECQRGREEAQARVDEADERVENQGCDSEQARIEPHLDVLGGGEGGRTEGGMAIRI